MRIISMTATFGRLEGKTLTLEPGLNVIQAPNEWGKSTWCAFLAAMLYGLDTRAKSTKTALADKERFAPWSGSPMAGRVELCWQGRNITIERTTRGRVPLGQFRAFETETGMPVPELTGDNCGSMLLGVEQSVFRRAGFIRQQDMPVTRDEALRRRLNDLVTTGDESGDADRMEQALRDLKNRCRHNRTGRIPQIREELDQVQEKLRELETLDSRCRDLKQRLAEEKQYLRALENHRDALRYAAAEDDARRVALARDERDKAERAVSELEAACARIPSKEEAQRRITALENLIRDLAELAESESRLKSRPEPPRISAIFDGLTPEQAQAMVEKDTNHMVRLTATKPWLLWFAAGGILGLLALVLGVMGEFVPAVISLAAVPLALIPGLGKKKAWQAEASALEKKYGSSDPAQWTQTLEDYRTQQEEYRRACLEYRVARGDLDIQATFLQKQKESLCALQEPEAVLRIWQQTVKRREEYGAACRVLQSADTHLRALQSMAKPAVPPAMTDTLTGTMEQTEEAIRENREQQQRLLSRLGQYQGRMEAIGDPRKLLQRQEELSQQLEKLEDLYAAASIALDTLEKARRELQRRFAPRISGKAQEYLNQLTGGRYDRLTLAEDLSLLAGAQGETVLHEVLWRSDGTVDQLYFALRLAVAEALTPEAPLVLDDAFVRFDDTRLKAALELLEKTAREKQVILFTCQSREKELLK